MIAVITKTQKIGHFVRTAIIVRTATIIAVLGHDRSPLLGLRQPHI